MQLANKGANSQTLGTPEQKCQVGDHEAAARNTKRGGVTDFSIRTLLASSSTRDNESEAVKRRQTSETATGQRRFEEDLVVYAARGEDPTTVGPKLRASSCASACLYACSFCNYRTDRKNNLERHARTMHSSLLEPHECCDQTFRNKAELRQHTKLCHKDGYTCTRCAKIFPRRALLARHAAIHSGMKRHRCWFCGYATSHKSNFDRHLRVHRSQQMNVPYQIPKEEGQAMGLHAPLPQPNPHLETAVNPEGGRLGTSSWTHHRHRMSQAAPTLTTSTPILSEVARQSASPPASDRDKFLADLSNKVDNNGKAATTANVEDDDDFIDVTSIEEG